MVFQTGHVLLFPSVRSYRVGKSLGVKVIESNASLTGFSGTAEAFPCCSRGGGEAVVA